MNPQAAMTDPQMDAHRKLLGWMPTDSPVMDARYRACLVEGHHWHRIRIRIQDSRLIHRMISWRPK